MNRTDVLAKMNSNIDRIRQFGAEKIGLFGSVARSEETTGSDLDILVRFASGSKTFDNFMGLKFYLESLFPGYSIDLVIEETLKPRIKDVVSKETIYAS